MAEEWKRPGSVPFPSVWSRFEGKREINGQIPKFWVQDIPEDMFETAVQTMLENFIYDEAMCKAKNIADDKLSVEEMTSLWRTLVQHKLGLMCFMENPEPNGKPIIAGLNMTYLCKQGDADLKFEEQKSAQVLGAVMHLTHIKDAFQTFGIRSYVSAVGLSVLPEFRGQGVGDELLKARTPLCKALGIKATLTVFTSFVSQKLADRTGFQNFTSVPYDELEKLGYSFPGIQSHTSDLKCMYKLID